MPFSRRMLLLGLGLVPFSACATDPTIGGHDGTAAEAPAPVQLPGIAALSRAIADLDATAATQPDPYRAAAQTQLAQWQERLCAADPLTGGTAVFPVVAGTAGELTEVAAATVAAVDTALEQAETQPMRLLLISIQLGATGLAYPAAVPGGLQAAPATYPDSTVEAAQGVVLTHVWAMVQALEKGIGVLAEDDPVGGDTVARLGEMKQLRNELIVTLGEDRPAQDLHYELPTITDAASLRSARAQLERGLMDAFAGVAAAGDAAWLPRAIAQVPLVQALGGQLPVWPGWVTT